MKLRELALRAAAIATACMMPLALAACSEGSPGTSSASQGGGARAPSVEPGGPRASVRALCNVIRASLRSRRASRDVFETEARPGLERLASKAAKKNRHASLAQREAMDVLQGLYDSDAQPRVVAVATEKLIDQANASLRAIGMRPVVCGG